jgi:preprotein translocase subunit SecD
MKKRYRFLLTVALMGLGFYFLYPSLQWYFLTPQADKDLAESSRNAIKVYAQEKGLEVADELQALARGNQDASVPEEYSFLVPLAKAKYEQAKAVAPSAWNLKAVLSAYSGRTDLAADIENHYRAKILDLKTLRDRTLQLGLDLRGGMYIVLRADFASLEKNTGKALTDAEKQDKIKGALDTLRNRIDQYGLSEPAIRTQGSDSIIVEIPGTQDPEKVNQFVKGRGSLTFHIVDDDGLAKVRTYQEQTGSVLLDAAGNVRDAKVLEVLPAGDELLGVFRKDAYGMDELKGFTVVKKEVGLNGEYLTRAQVSRDPITQKTVVVFSLTSEGGDTFYKLTSANVGKRMAVVLDNKVQGDAPTIENAIRDQVQVSGISESDAADLAPFPFPWTS